MVFTGVEAVSIENSGSSSSQGSICAFIEPSVPTLSAIFVAGSSDSHLTVAINMDGKIGFSTASDNLVSSYALPLNAYSHVCVTLASTGAKTIYIDGNVVGNSFDGAVKPIDSSFVVGGPGFVGHIDNLVADSSVFDRAAVAKEFAIGAGGDTNVA